MADGRRFDGSQRARTRRLAATLRREARAERPEFSAALHGRVAAAVAALPGDQGVQAAERRPFGLRSTAIVGALATALACLWFAFLVVRSRPAPQASAPAGDVAGQGTVPGIERLPTPGEIREDVLVQVTTLAAAAVGIPEWTDLVAFAPAELGANELVP